MKDRNKDYWHERINNIFDRSIRENEIAEIYRGQYRDIEKKIIELYNRAVKQKIVTRTDLYSFYSFQKLLKSIEKQNKDIKAKLCRETVLTLQRAYKETFSSVTEMLDGDSHWGVQNEEMLKSVLNTKWEGNNFSSRIWENTEKLSQRIKADVTTAIVQGTGKDTLVKNIMRDYNVGFSKADRLVRTETMHAINQAQLDTYAKEGVEEVEWNAGFDERMCDICSSMHGRKYKIGEAPTLMHPNCRCTLVPVIPDNWFDDEYLEERDKKKRGSSQIHPKKAVAANKRALTKGKNGGIINTNRGINMYIDKFTPCLENTKTGKLEQTKYMLVTPKELQSLKGWKFDWTSPDLKEADVYKLTLENNDKIQGLVAISYFAKDKAVYVNIVESAPHNIGSNKQYNGVGGHLYAIAAQKSVEKGYGGFLFMDAKNLELVEHYQNTLGAVLIGRPHPYRMVVDEDAAHKLLDIYTLKGE